MVPLAARESRHNRLLECGRPFLVLDARRRFFCNDRERYRHAQRERRKRMAVHDSGTGTESLTVEIVREGVEQ